MLPCQENREPPPHHTHTQCTTHTHNGAYTYIMYLQSSVRKMLPCQENREPPPPTTHTHNALHIHTMCAYYSTLSRLSEKCFLVRKIETPPHTHTHTPHTHNTVHIMYIYTHINIIQSSDIYIPSYTVVWHTHTIHYTYTHCVHIVLTVICQENASLSGN